ncbi:MAG: NifB/NifX family molybdenum-iron cluster-binding protein [Ancalomicrobiaceae bacterium]|nr:NifB/NifX family molybdenum-iron cluster-binding protein [Ancalomicrobiaceae bacterium]
MTVLLAIPSDAPGGPEAHISTHFGHCDVFSVFAINDGKIVDQSILAFPPHEHGDCLVPVGLLAEQGVTAMVASGMGRRPLVGFISSGIQPYFAGEHAKVGDIVAAFVAGDLMPFGLEGACGGHGDGACDHDH